MSEPALQASQRTGRMFSRSRVRDNMGPSHPLYHLMNDLAIQSVYTFKEDWDRGLQSNVWLSTQGDSNLEIPTTDARGGVARFNNGADEDGVLVQAASQMVWDSGHRPVALSRFWLPVVTEAKFEFGFADDADIDDGQVNAKTTPTSTGVDYAVIIYDDDHNANVGLHADNQAGDATGPSGVASSPGITVTNNVAITAMIALNEQQEAYFWLNGVSQGVLRTGVPDPTIIGAQTDPNPATSGTALSLWFCLVDRDAAGTAQVDIDYIKAWQERVAVI